MNFVRVGCLATVCPSKLSAALSVCVVLAASCIGVFSLFGEADTATVRLRGRHSNEISQA